MVCKGIDYSVQLVLENAWQSVIACLEVKGNIIV